MPRLVIAVLLVLSACSSSAPVASEPASIAAVSTDRDTIVVPLSLHVLVEEGTPQSELSSMRTTEELAAIATDMNEIWADADVTFDPINVHQLEVPTLILQTILLGETSEFFAQVNRTFTVENSQAINGFYVRHAFGVNGFTPDGSNLFFVIDEPSVPDARVSSHEVGHILGLHHDLTDVGRLMFSGTNGTSLTQLEQTVARYSAVGLFRQDGAP